MNKYILLIITSLIGHTLFSQNNCDWSSLNDADKSYQSGNFNETIKLINQCINEGFNEQQKVHRLCFDICRDEFWSQKMVCIKILPIPFHPSQL